MKYIPICHANPQDIVDYKNFYIMSENKTNKYTIEMYSQDQVDEREKELKAQIVSYKADAERYRWLRDNGCIFWTDLGTNKEVKHQVCEQAMDDVVDNASKESN